MTTNNLDSILDQSVTLTDLIQQICWSKPWLQHLAVTPQLIDAAGAEVAPLQSRSLPPSVATWLNHQLQTLATRPPPDQAAASRWHSGWGKQLRFVPQEALPQAMAYETFIARTGGVPTRDNLHDLFNGSIWLTFPKSKALLNRYQADTIDRDGICGSRGPVRDTITVFDENGALLVTADPKIGEALSNFDWQNCLVRPRSVWENPQHPDAKAQAAVYIFGHALLEQLVTPRKPLCSHTVIIHVTPEFFAWPKARRLRYLDEQLAEYLEVLLQDKAVTPKMLSPLPVLGVPHFWPDNIHQSFYEDRFVFRSGRRR